MFPLLLFTAIVTDGVSRDQARARLHELRNRLDLGTTDASARTFPDLLAMLARRAALLEEMQRLVPGVFEAQFLPAALGLAGFDADMDLEEIPGVTTGQEGFLRWAFGAWTVDARPRMLPLSVEALRTVRDWAFSTGADLRGLTWGKAVGQAEAWHAIQAAAVQEELPGGTPFLPSGTQVLVRRWEDGWTLVDLRDAAALDAETAALGHCVGLGAYDDLVATGRGQILSLRSPDGRPRVTIEVNNDFDNRSATWRFRPAQARGRANSAPFRKYNMEALRALRFVQPNVDLWYAEVRALLPEEEIHARRDEDAAISRAYLAILRLDAWSFRPFQSSFEGASRVMHLQVAPFPGGIRLGGRINAARVSVFLSVDWNKERAQFIPEIGITVDTEEPRASEGWKNVEALSARIFGPSLAPEWIAGVLDAGALFPSEEGDVVDVDKTRVEDLDEDRSGRGHIVVLRRDAQGRPLLLPIDAAKLVVHAMRSFDADNRVRWTRG